MGQEARVRGAIMRTLGIAGLCVLALLTLAISVGSAPAGAATSRSATNARAFKAYQSCLASHGVKLPRKKGGGFPGGGPPRGKSGSFTPPSGFKPPNGPRGFPGGAGGSSKFAKAQAACKAKLPKGFSGGFTGRSMTAAQKQALQTYISCMQSHGVSVSSNVTFGQIQSLVKSDSQAKTANASCQGDLRSAFPTGRPPGKPPPSKK